MSIPDGGGEGTPRLGFLQLSPAGPVDLGQVVVAEDATVTFTVSNNGNGNLTVRNVTVSGSEWVLSSLPSFPKLVSPTSSFQFTLTLTPTGIGAKSTTVTAAWQDANGTEPPVTVAVSATAVAAAVTAQGTFIPKALGFPTTQVNRTSTLQTSIRSAGNNVSFQVTAFTLASSIAAPIFTGVGLDDMTDGGAYTQSISDATQTYTIIIDGNGTPDTFKWKLDAGSFTTTVNITGALQTLSHGVQVKFAATTGHTIGDQWIVVVTPSKGAEYTIDSTTLPTLPYTVHAPQTLHPISIIFNPTVVGNLTDSLIAVTDSAGNIACPLQGICLLVVPIAVCINNTQEVVVGGYDSDGLQGMPAPLVSLANDYDSDQDGSIVFNGALWEALGQEKTIFRLGFYYENLGVATLTGTLAVFRPQGGTNNFQTVSFSITLGTSAADKTTRYEEVDVIATGEIITLSLARAASSGPISLCAIAPFFESRGEKVRAS